jgi:cytochrome c oxidase subunit IV
MNTRTYAIWRRNILVWLALLLLLMLTFGVAHLSLGVGNVVAGLAIATIKAGLVVMIFMGLRSANGLIKLTAAAGVFWLIFLFALTLSDVLARLANK